MNREKLISREYKLVLKTENFLGDEFGLVNNAQAYWMNFKRIIKPLIKITNGVLNTISIRKIRFYDTGDFKLNNSNYIFRERKELDNDKNEVTLKFRHPDRYVSQDRDMLPKKNIKRDIKFEEDIKASFLKLYSFSSTQDITEKKPLKKIMDITQLYPGLEKHLNKLGKKENIYPVHDLTIKEIVITGTKFTICKNPLVEAECALIVWYDWNAEDSDPLIIEFSFRYGNKKEKYSNEAALKSYELFLLIQEKMKSWIDSDSGTKTNFVYHNK